MASKIICTCDVCKCEIAAVKSLLLEKYYRKDYRVGLSHFGITRRLELCESCAKTIKALVDTLIEQKKNE